jgi:endonuclease YncB( thermonuclease family)
MVEGSGPYSYRRHWRESVFPFWKLIAEEMLRSGFAVLLFDKPGVNKSTGDWKRQSFLD